MPRSTVGVVPSGRSSENRQTGQGGSSIANDAASASRRPASDQAMLRLPPRSTTACNLPSLSMPIDAGAAAGLAESAAVQRPLLRARLHGSSDSVRGPPPAWKTWSVASPQSVASPISRAE